MFNRECCDIVGVVADKGYYLVQHSRAVDVVPFQKQSSQARAASVAVCAVASAGHTAARIAARQVGTGSSSGSLNLVGTVGLGFEDYMRARTIAELHLLSVPENTACYIGTSGHAKGREATAMADWLDEQDFLALM